jgi:hypothetical protein
MSVPTRGMSGRLLADKLLPCRPGIRILFMSGYTAEAIGHHGVLAPGTAFLQKPFTPGALACRVGKQPSGNNIARFRSRAKYCGGGCARWQRSLRQAASTDQVPCR